MDVSTRFLRDRSKERRSHLRYKLFWGQGWYGEMVFFG